LKGYIVDTGYI